MSGRDKRDNAGTTSIVPEAVRRDTRGHPFRGVSLCPDRNRLALAEELKELARQIGRLVPDWRSPERYFERRDELRQAALDLGERVGRHG